LCIQRLLLLSRETAADPVRWVRCNPPAVIPLAGLECGNVVLERRVEFKKRLELPPPIVRILRLLFSSIPLLDPAPPPAGMAARMFKYGLG
jgi:hypothetical protein